MGSEQWAVSSSSAVSTCTRNFMVNQKKRVLTGRETPKECGGSKGAKKSKDGLEFQEISAPLASVRASVTNLGCPSDPEADVTVVSSV